jgi:N-acyl-L-homoserine lactone synthetase
LQQFRKRLFVDTLGWQLPVSGEIERDQFDNGAAVHCALFVGEILVGGFRAIRTDCDYLAKRVFPQLATTRPYPSSHRKWEISRFGVEPSRRNLELARINYSLMFRFAQTRQATGLVAIADLTYERYLAKLDIRTRRYGPPQVIGSDRFGKPIQVVAGEIPLADQSGPKFNALLRIANQVTIDDQALVLGRTRVSA